MITLHWAYILFAIFVIVCFILSARNFSEDSGIGGGIIGLIWFAVLLIGIAVFGGIFWW